MTAVAFPGPTGKSPTHVIFTTMKNEGPFMLEWIAHNLTIGFDGFVIYTNDCDDGTDLIAKRLEALGIARHVENAVRPGGNPQHQALRRARNHPWVKNAAWLMCLDVDEFINITVGAQTIQDLTEAVGPVDAISLAWRLFGCGGVEQFSDRPVTTQFLLADNPDRYATGRAYGLKTLFQNNGSFARFGPHRPKDIPQDRLGSIKWSDAAGNLFPPDRIGWRAWAGFQHDFGRVFHYAVRSVESFMVKRDRGRTNHIKVDQAETYWRDMNINKVPEDAMLALTQKAALVRSELMEDPQLHELHSKACIWHEAKIAELYQRDDWSDFRNWLHANKIAIGQPNLRKNP